MRKVFLITGFNNWGKTTLISDLFGTKTFRKNIPQYYSNCPFVVMPQSNDDLGKKGYEKEFFDRLTEFEKVNGKAKYIVSAFCPTKEPKNNSIEILRKIFKNDKIEMLLLEHKWCGHAKLILPEVTQFYSTEKNVTVHAITSKSPNGKLGQVQSVFSGNLP
jgi:calcineurin-like phosphoesterase family protein